MILDYNKEEMPDAADFHYRVARIIFIILGFTGIGLFEIAMHFNFPKWIIAFAVIESIVSCFTLIVSVIHERIRI